MYEAAFKNIDNTLREDDGCETELDYIEQTSLVLFFEQGKPAEESWYNKLNVGRNMPKTNLLNLRANALKEVKRRCKELGFTAGMLKGALAEGRKKQ